MTLSRESYTKPSFKCGQLLLLYSLNIFKLGFEINIRHNIMDVFIKKLKGNQLIKGDKKNEKYCFNFSCTSVFFSIDICLCRRGANEIT